MGLWLVGLLINILAASFGCCKEVSISNLSLAPHTTYERNRVDTASLTDKGIQYKTKRMTSCRQGVKNLLVGRLLLAVAKKQTEDLLGNRS